MQCNQPCKLVQMQANQRLVYVANEFVKNNCKNGIYCGPKQRKIRTDKHYLK